MVSILAWYDMIWHQACDSSLTTCNKINLALNLSSSLLTDASNYRDTFCLWKNTIFFWKNHLDQTKMLVAQLSPCSPHHDVEVWQGQGARVEETQLVVTSLEHLTKDRQTQIIDNWQVCLLSKIERNRHLGRFGVCMRPLSIASALERHVVYIFLEIFNTTLGLPEAAFQKQSDGRKPARMGLLPSLPIATISIPLIFVYFWCWVAELTVGSGGRGYFGLWSYQQDEG